MDKVEFWMDALPVVLVGVVFYCLVIRPARRAERRRFLAVASLVGGERVEIAGGVLGWFESRQGPVYRIRLADGLCIETLEGAITRVQPRPDQRPSGLPADSGTPTS